jgi:hypothetical protein
VSSTAKAMTVLIIETKTKTPTLSNVSPTLARLRKPQFGENCVGV